MAVARLIKRILKVALLLTTSKYFFYTQISFVVRLERSSLVISIKQAEILVFKSFETLR